MKILAFGNYKGGVGKTLMSTNFSAAVARQERLILHIDFDQQGNSTEALGATRHQPGLAEFLRGTEELGTLIHPHVEGAQDGFGLPDLYILGPGNDLEGFQAEQGRHFDEAGQPTPALEAAVARLSQGLEVLNEAAAHQGKPIDIVVLDTRPDSNWGTTLALGVADAVVVPIRADEASSTGTADFSKRIDIVRSTLNPRLEFMGVFINDLRKSDKNWEKKVHHIHAQYGPKLFKSVIGGSTHIVDGYTARTPAVHAFPDSDGARFIRNLTNEILTKLGLEGK